MERGCSSPPRPSPWLRSCDSETQGPSPSQISKDEKRTDAENIQWTINECPFGYFVLLEEISHCATFQLPGIQVGGSGLSLEFGLVYGLRLRLGVSNALVSG